MQDVASSTPTHTAVPWYRQFWPWFLIALPASAVIAGLTTVYIAAHNTDGLVVDDYYKQGLAINQTLQRQQRASTLHLAATVDWNTRTDVITLQLSSATAEYPPQLKLTFSHPTRAHLDSEVVLHQTPVAGQYTGHLLLQSQGNWHMILEPADQSWLLTGRAQIPGQQHWELSTQ